MNYREFSRHESILYLWDFDIFYFLSEISSFSYSLVNSFWAFRIQQEHHPLEEWFSDHLLV